MSQQKRITQAEIKQRYVGARYNDTTVQRLVQSSALAEVYRDFESYPSAERMRARSAVQRRLSRID